MRRALGAALLAAASVAGSPGGGPPPDVLLLGSEGWVMGPTSIPDPAVGGYLALHD